MSHPGAVWRLAFLERFFRFLKNCVCFVLFVYSAKENMKKVVLILLLRGLCIEGSGV